MTTTLQVYKAKQHTVYHYSAALQCNCNINMKNLLIIIQTLTMLTSSLFCLSQECYNKEEIYTGTKLPYSCKHILTDYPATPSGYYLIQPPGASAVQVYCDMENERCGSKGWTRVAHVDVSNDKSCPGDLTFISSPIQSCGGPTTAGCASANFSTHGISYSQVCGRLRGYQVGGPDAFGPYINDPGKPDLVVDGVMISCGKAQKHIWTYACGQEKTMVHHSNIHCPCTDPKYNGIVPPFIGNDYYCDSGVQGGSVVGRFYTTPLWTGEGCTPPNFCCSRSRMPWFCKTLPVPTTDYIEIRNCRNQPSIEDIALDLIELYIK